MSQTSASLRFGILGDLYVASDTGHLDVGPRLQRHLLVVLLVEAGRVGVAVDRLVDLLWGDEPPSTGARVLAGLCLPVAEGPRAGAAGARAGPGPRDAGPRLCAEDRTGAGGRLSVPGAGRRGSRAARPRRGRARRRAARHRARPLERRPAGRIRGAGRGRSRSCRDSKRHTTARWRIGSKPGWRSVATIGRSQSSKRWSGSGPCVSGVGTADRGHLPLRPPGRCPACLPAVPHGAGRRPRDRPRARAAPSRAGRLGPGPGAGVARGRTDPSAPSRAPCLAGRGGTLLRRERRGGADGGRRTSPRSSTACASASTGPVTGAGVPSCSWASRASGRRPSPNARPSSRPRPARRSPGGAVWTARHPRTGHGSSCSGSYPTATPSARRGGASPATKGR